MRDVCVRPVMRMFPSSLFFFTPAVLKLGSSKQSLASRETFQGFFHINDQDSRELVHEMPVLQ